MKSYCAIVEIAVIAILIIRVKMTTIQITMTAQDAMVLVVGVVNNETNKLQ
jgi:hypothetical protein